MKSSALDDLPIREGQRVMLIKTGPAFGSGRSARAVEEVFGLEGLRLCREWFEDSLKAAGITVSDEGTAERLYGDGYIGVKFDGHTNTIDIPEHCLLPITAEG